MNPLESAQRPHLLMVTYYFPPLGMGGVQRPLKFAKYLPQFGWDVTVLTADLSSYPETDATLLDDLPEGVNVVRIPGWEPGRRLRTRTARDARPVRRPAAALPRWAKGIQQLARWPDDKFGFVRPARDTARRLGRERPFDVVWTTSPPPSVHRVGLQLRHSGIPAWIADFRDPWLVHSGDWGPTAFHARYARNLHRRIVTESDAIVAVNDAVAGSIAETAGNTPVHVIHNGYDEDDFRFRTDGPVRLDGGPFTVAFYGTLSAVVDPAPALRLLARWRESAGVGLRIIHIGGCIGIDPQSAATHLGLGPVFESLGYMPHRSAIQRLLEADLVVIPLSTDPGYQMTVPGRLFEALRSLKPLLLCSSTDGEAAHVLGGIDGTWVVHPNDVDGGLAALKEIRDLPRGAPVRSVDAVAEFDRRNQSQRLAAILDGLRTQQFGAANT